MPRHTPRNGTPAAMRAKTASPSPESASREAACWKAPTPGRTTPAAARSGGGISRDTHARAGTLQSFGDAGQVAHAAVDDGDLRRAHGRASYSVPLVDGTASGSPCRSQATASALATPLKTASTTW